MTQNKLHLWFPNIFEFKGGIQTYSAFLLAAIQNLHPNDRLEVFLKHDKSASLNSISTLTRFHCTGVVPSSLRTPVFATQLVASGILQHPHLVIASHLNFAIAAYCLKQLLGIPYWVVAHGIEAWEIENPVVKMALHHADRILAVSNYTRNRLLIEQNLSPQKISILPNTFNSNRFQIMPKPSYLLDKYQLKPEQPVILTVARLEEAERYKGYDQILQAIPQIRESIPDIHYLIVGKGSDRLRIENQIAQLNLQNHVTIAGFVPDEQLCDHYNLCDVFAMPSKMEGFGIVYLEALACGKPVLAGNQDGATDALCHGELGALVNPDDVDTIAQTLIQILQGTYFNPLIYQKEALRQKVIENFGFEQFQKILSHHFKEHDKLLKKF